MSVQQVSSSYSSPSGDSLQSNQVSQLERHGYLFGKKLTASLSPFLHNVIYQDLGLKWGQVRLDSADIDGFLKLAQHPDFYGASVTMPNKVAIIPYLDELTEECRDVGACNTLYLRERDGRRIFCGANTDVIGIRDSFYQNISNPDAVFHNKPALVVGGGGAARSAIYALRKKMQARTIYLVNRDDAEVASVIADCAARGYGDGLLHVKTVSEASALEAPGAIVACVPDFEPVTADEVRARAVTEAFLDKAQKGAILEMCYNPTPFTKLGAIAEEKGWKVILGTEALIYQGLEQDKYWTGKGLSELPVEKVHVAIAEKVAQRAESKLYSLLSTTTIMTKPSPPRPLFVYGTLRALPLLAWALTGDATNTTAIAALARPAIVHGYARYAVLYRDYPAAVKKEDPGHEIDGFLLVLETKSQRKKLDDFEGEAYTPTPVLATLEDGSTVDADMYDRLEDWIDLFEGME
ncbi:hypothetical protein BKA59DRAFT_495070 [Fusarium tricinctum]|uniref:Quinate dehydrogenase n=1 Tax=Fusarium tricinctum TaxID=61284 RepID=A0A8K0RRV0_9HYPO|nr:hypothetical protein BKA59DRAFT_495070 [Fusarium tricinctum]